MRRDDQRLEDILQALDRIAGAVSGLTEEDFLSNDVICFAVARQLSVVGEAAANVSSQTREKNPLIPWRDIVAFRNILVHEYFGLNWNRVWETVADQAPILRERISAILTQGSSEKAE
jgi:uncharacterized protein with HEPN domain